MNTKLMGKNAGNSSGQTNSIPKKFGRRLAAFAVAVAAAHGFTLAAGAQTIVKIGIGTVHVADPAALGARATGTAELNRRVKDVFDPAGRMNPGRRVA